MKVYGTEIAGKVSPDLMPLEGPDPDAEKMQRIQQAAQLLQDVIQQHRAWINSHGGPTAQDAWKATEEAKIHFQTGLMWLVRSIQNPSSIV